jgi:hypothetical protein
MPLRKLLAKAKAAREKEMALERASIALRNGQLMYQGFSAGMEQIKPPPVVMNQPSSDDLDRMLRPSAPKLGGSPPPPRSSWPSSPARSTVQDSYSNGAGRHPAETQRVDNTSPNSVSGSPGQNFVNLANFGIDNVVQDVMQDMDYNGNSVFDFSNMQSGTAASRMPNITRPAQQTLPTATQSTRANTATAINGAHGTFGDTMFANVNFGDVPPVVGNGNNGQLSGSPLMDEGNMDWTMWDDMVTQYGLEGHTSNPNTNPASNGGLLNWF